jgi:hypothetical protein
LRNPRAEDGHVRIDLERTKSRIGVSVAVVLGLTIVTARPIAAAPKPKSTPTPTRTATPAASPTAAPTFTPTPAPTPTKTPPPPPDGLAVTIEYPLDGSVTPWNVTDVRGVIAGPERIGVLVNGQAAVVGLDANGRRVFFVDALPLATGDVAITASALTIEGSEVSHSVRVNAAGARVPVRMSANPAAGGSPLAVTFEVQVDDGVSYAYPTIDFDGDGTVDATVTQRKATLSHTYSQPGLHRASLQSKSQNRLIVDEVGILVANENDLVASLEALWEEFRAALRNREMDRALSLVVVSSRERASLLLTAMTDHGIDPDAVYTGITLLQLYDGFAEFEMVRPDAEGNPIGFVIHFARDVDGIWRIKTF